MCVQPPDDSVPPEPTESPEDQDNTAQPGGGSSSNPDEEEEEEDGSEDDSGVESDNNPEQWPVVVQPKPLAPRQSLNVNQKCPANFVETPYVDVVSFSHYHIHAFMLVVSCVSLYQLGVL